MAALSRPSKATYEVHEQVTVDTSGKLESETFEFCSLDLFAAAPAELNAVTSESDKASSQTLNFYWLPDNEDHTFWYV
jgi:hypothetical protein